MPKKPRHLQAGAGAGFAYYRLAYEKVDTGGNQQ